MHAVQAFSAPVTMSVPLFGRMDPGSRPEVHGVQAREAGLRAWFATQRQPANGARSSFTCVHVYMGDSKNQGP